MTERVTETVDPAGNVTERTVERDTPTTTVIEKRGGGGLLIGLVFVAILALAAFVFLGMNSSETKKDNAIAGAAEEVGQAADQIGDAVDNAAK